MDITFFAVLLIGFVIGYIIYELFKVRAGGVIAIPLLVLYTMHNIYFFFAILLTSLAVFLILELIFKKTAIYGRRLLYVSFIFSIALTAIVMILMGETSSAFVSIIPGLIGYNFHREKNSTGNIMKSLVVADLYAIFVILVALILISTIGFNPSFVHPSAGILGLTGLATMEIGGVPE